MVCLTALLSESRIQSRSPSTKNRLRRASVAPMIPKLKCDSRSPGLACMLTLRPSAPTVPCAPANERYGLAARCHRYLLLGYWSVRSTNRILPVGHVPEKFRSQGRTKSVPAPGGRDVVRSDPMTAAPSNIPGQSREGRHRLKLVSLAGSRALVCGFQLRCRQHLNVAFRGEFCDRRILRIISTRVREP